MSTDQTTVRRGLAPSEVDVWMVRIDARVDSPLEVREALLPEEERAELARVLAEERRRLRGAGRVLRRLVLSRYADVAPEAWRFRTTPGGRPEIAAPSIWPPLRFSVAHTRGLVACAVAIDRDVGVDVEALDRRLDVDALARRVFAREEIDALARLDPSARRIAFFERWTLKEALLKARGVGLAVSPAAVVVRRRSPEGGWVLAFAPPLEDNPAAWQVEVVQPTSRHLLALAARGQPGAPLSVALHWTTL